MLLTFDDGYADLIDHAFPTLQECGFGAAVFVVTAHMGGDNRWDRARGSAPQQLMSRQQIRQWAERGVEFGSHTRTHPDLTALSRERVASEVRGSLDELSDVVGAHVTSFAYPYGCMNDEVGNAPCKTRTSWPFRAWKALIPRRPIRTGCAAAWCNPAMARSR